MTRGHDLQKIIDQVPANYYDSNEQNLLQRFWHNERWRVVSRLIHEGSNRILDVGCASGHFTNKIHLLKPKAKVTGIDLSDKFINFARKRYKTINFVRADAQNLPFGDKSFDLIVCSEVLDHVDNPRRLLKELNRCLNDKGLVLLSLDELSPLFRFLWFFWKRFGPGKVWRYAHIQHFTKESVENLIEVAGFSIKKQTTSLMGMIVFYSLKKKNY